MSDKIFLKDPIQFLRDNPYGFFDGDNESAIYDFTWKPNFQALVTDICETLDSYSIDEELEHLDKEWRDSLQLANQQLEKGHIEDAFNLLQKLWPVAFGEQAGISWWGTFETLKSDDDPWPEMIRSGFRGTDDKRPIEPMEELNFAHYVTCDPFEWGGSVTV